MVGNCLIYSKMLDLFNDLSGTLGGCLCPCYHLAADQQNSFPQKLLSFIHVTADHGVTPEQMDSPCMFWRVPQIPPSLCLSFFPPVTSWFSSLALFSLLSSEFSILGNKSIPGRRRNYKFEFALSFLPSRMW